MVTSAVLAACSGEFAGPSLDPEPSAEILLSDDGTTATYTFDELVGVCDLFQTVPSTYEDLTFVDGADAPVAPTYAPCTGANGTIALQPSDLFGGGAETFIRLPAPASAVSIESYLFDFGEAPTLVAYDAAGAQVGSSSNGQENAVSLLSVDGAGAEITRIGLRLPQWVGSVDNLTVTYISDEPEPAPGPDPEPEPAPTDPVTAEDCRDGSWAAFGFSNQGQCVRFTESGWDSRTEPVVLMGTSHGKGKGKHKP
jgi:hypothetical protein